MDIMRQSACLVVNQIKVHSYDVLFNCTTGGQASDSMTTLMLLFNLLVGACYLSLAGPTVAKLEIFFSSEYMCLMSHFSFFHHSVLF